MCGIVVGLAFGKINQRDESTRQKLLRYFTTELLLATEERGKDATGAAILFNDGKYVGVKRGEQASSFLGVFGETEDCYGSLLKVWREHPKRGRIYIGHCRAGTTGDKEDNENNHPIKIGNLVGIHNGVISNHEEIFEKLGCKRDGKVDSEAIFRLFEYYTQKGKEPFTLDMLQEVVNRLDGQFAVTLFNADNLDQVPIFRDRRPVEFVLIRRYGILLMISEEKFWNRIYFRYERMANYYNEMHKVKLPIFLDDDEIETETMPDDTGMIFDISKKVDMKTKISDLYESTKMLRSNKIWQKRIGGTTYYPYNNRSAIKRTGTWVKKDETTDAVKKRRVFDNITKAYKIKVGDKELDPKEATTLPVDKKDEKDDTATKLTTVTKKEKEEAKTVKTPEATKSSIRKDEKEEKSSPDKVEVKDLTTYDKNEENIIDVDPRDVQVVDTKPADVIEVQMTKYTMEIVEAANKAYEEIPSKEKGCGSVDELLDILEIASKEKARSLGMGLVGNRAIKHGWLQGYMYAAKKLSGNSEEKAQRREKHIAGLKSLVMLLASFYERNNTIEANTHLAGSTKKRLAQVALDNNRRINMEKLMKIFNSHEKGVLKGVSDVLSQADGVIKND